MDAAREFAARLSGAVPAGPAGSSKPLTPASPPRRNDENHLRQHIQSPRRAGNAATANGHHTKDSLLRKSSSQHAPPLHQQQQPSKWADERERNRSKKLGTEGGLDWNNNGGPSPHHGNGSGGIESRSWAREGSNHGPQRSPANRTSGRFDGPSSSSRNGGSGGAASVKSPREAKSIYTPPSSRSVHSSSNSGARKSDRAPAPAPEPKETPEEAAQRKAKEEAQTSQSLLELMTTKIEHFDWADEE